MYSVLKVPTPSESGWSPGGKKLLILVLPFDIVKLPLNSCVRELFIERLYSFGSTVARYSYYHCKQCNSWHTFTQNKTLMRHRAQHARGGRQTKKKVSA